MSSGSIYPYIPFASSLVWNRRSPENGVKVHVSFSPDWFSRRIDLDYGERWHRDPVFRRQSFVDMARALNTEFPALKLGGDPELIHGGISQIHTCAEVNTLGVPNIAEHLVFEDLMQQIDLIEGEWGQVDGELNYQGVLNTAFRLRGEQIFLDMVTEPQRAHRVLMIVCRTMINLADSVYARQGKTGIHKDYFVTSNCVVNMISESHYREFIMPYDRMLAEHYPHFGIHNCGWTVNNYAQPYSEIGNLEYLDFGIQSDLKRLRELFPETVLAVIMNPNDVLGRNPAEIEKDLWRLKENLGSCCIIIGSFDSTTDTEEILSFFQTAAKVWAVPVQQLVPKAHFG